MKISKEVVLYGSISLISGLFQLADYYLFSHPQALYLGSLSVALGVLITAIGLFWQWGPWERPLGITLLAVSFSFSGILALFVGGWIFTPLFLLAFVLFGIAWALYKGKAWGRMVAIIVAVLGVLLSLIGLASDGVVYSPGILQGAYLLWYMGRPHVTSFFQTEDIFDIEISRRALIVLIFVALAFVPVLTRTYAEPPTYTIVSRNFELWGSGGWGGTGQLFSANRGDMLAYSFEVLEGGPVRFYIKTSELPSQQLISLPEEYSGSGSAVIPFTAQWQVMVETQATHMKAFVEIRNTGLSLRPSIIQLLLLDFYLAAVLLSCIYAYKNMALTLYV